MFDRDVTTGPIAINTSRGRATFEITAPDRARIEVVHDVPERTIGVVRGDFASAIASLIEAEVAEIRVSMMEFRAGLAAQLSDEGRHVPVSDSWSAQWSRRWKDNGDTFTVAGRRQRIWRDVPVDTRNSKRVIVEATIDNIMAQEEEISRDMFMAIMNEATDERLAANKTAE